MKIIERNKGVLRNKHGSKIWLNIKKGQRVNNELEREFEIDEPRRKQDFLSVSYQ